MAIDGGLPDGSSAATAPNWRALLLAKSAWLPRRDRMRDRARQAVNVHRLLEHPAVELEPM